MNEYLILEKNGDGGWLEHGRVEAGNQTSAVERFVHEHGRTNGTYLAVATRMFVPLTIQPVTVLKAVREEQAA